MNLREKAEAAAKEILVGVQAGYLAKLHDERQYAIEQVANHVEAVAREFAVASICVFANAEDIATGVVLDAFNEALRYAIAAAERGE